MTWTDNIRTGSRGSSPKGPSKTGAGIKVVESENDFPILHPNFIRIGSAHARERSGDRQSLADLLHRFCEAFNTPSSTGSDTNTIRIEEKE